MTTYEFVLVLDGTSASDDRIEDALFEAGCDDATLAFRGGVAYLEFHRDAGGLKSAVLSAIRDVERADHEAMVSHVEPGDIVTASEIARRLDLTREYVRLLVLGERGAGGFPVPRLGVTGTTLLWSWTDVLRWFEAQGPLDDPARLLAAETIRDINFALGVREEPVMAERQFALLKQLSSGGRLRRARRLS